MGRECAFRRVQSGINDRSFAASGLLNYQSARSRNQLHRIQETTENTPVSVELQHIMTSDYLCFINAFTYLQQS